uniref:Uncharacterized protein n=1 Tax=Human betaherpesvirus 6 TaxID=10368 RepID=A0A5P9U8G2_9BETA|nr:hypothetical protein [Human betaherpesvirus 6]
MTKEHDILTSPVNIKLFIVAFRLFPSTHSQ